MNNSISGTAICNNNFQGNGMVFSELVEWLKNIDMNAEGTARVNVYSIGDNNGERIKL